MKTLKIFILLLVVSTVAMAQDINPSEVPETVRNAFMKDHNKATDVEWERDMDNYKVEFDVGRKDYAVWYTAAGNVIKKEQDITEADLPDAVREAIKREYPGYYVNDVEMTWQNNETTYQMELEKGQEEWKVVFDAMGKTLHKRRD